MNFVFGEHDEATVKQIENVLKDTQAVAGGLCADGHKGYSVPIGGVVAYADAVSPSGVGYDIGCGNKAVCLDADADYVTSFIEEVMDEVAGTISFGVGQKNQAYNAYHDELWGRLVAHSAWDIEAVGQHLELAHAQLGTVGSGNHYVDIFIDDTQRVWVGVHFGSRGLGHKIASHYIKQGGGKDGMDVAPVVLPLGTQLADEYLAAMDLAGQYAYAGRDWVCQKVADILGANITEEVHNHHNFAWLEEHPLYGGDVWVVRKGSTPAFPGQLSFVGGSMGDHSVILRGIDSELSRQAMYSTVHGAGRVMSRTAAAGKKKWIGGRPVRVTEGAVSKDMMDEWVRGFGVALRGAGTDESPHVYRRLTDVIAAHEGTIEITTRLRPIGVAMAGEGEFDPYKD